MASRTAALARSGRSGLWNALVRAYQWIESTERGYVWLGKLLPAFLFGLVAVMKAVALVEALSRATGAALEPKTVLLLGHLASGTAFFGLVTTFYLLRRRPIRRVEGPIQGLAALAGSYIMLPVAMAGGAQDNLALLFVANILLIIGTAGAAVSLAVLGRCFGIFPEARGLVKRGPYRFVRHPMYLFEFVAFFGVLLVGLTPVNAMIYAIFVGLQLSRMVFEEQVLSATFPDEYPAYSKNTARLIPGIF